jgi:prepilin-type N-terminal cleavage/methylation domain-containing protein
MRQNDRNGFTLIELLVVIAIIGLLASIILADLNTARMKADDAKKMAELRSIQTALENYYLDHNAMPINQTPGVGYNDTEPNFLGELVAGGYIPGPLKSPTDFPESYYYFDYGPGNYLGVLVATVLDAAPPSVNGYPGSCRPFAAGTNWCDLRSTTEYCLCLPY